MNEAQMAMAKALDEALFWFGRPAHVEEPKPAFALKFALRRSLCLAAACEGRILWQSFVNACMHCLGPVEEWAGTEIGTAYHAILSHGFVCDEPKTGKDTGRFVCVTLPSTQGEMRWT